MASNYSVEITSGSPTRGGLLVTLDAIGALHDSENRIHSGIAWEKPDLEFARLASGYFDTEFGITPNAPKTFDEPTTPGDKDPFVVYKGAQGMVGIAGPDAVKNRQAFDRGEGHAVETAVEALYFGGATDLNTGTAVSIQAALAQLEEHYAGVPVRPLLHVGRFGGSYLSNERNVSSDGGTLWTDLGVPFAVGSGYGRGSATGQEFLIYGVTGLDLFRAPIEEGSGRDIQANVETHLVERVYASALTGSVISVTVDPTL